MLVLLLCCLSCASLFSTPIDHAIVSIYAVDTKTNEVLMDEKSDISLPSSSCLKLLTTAASLELLEKEMRFQTELQTSGKLDAKEGILHGNLLIKGGGDPTLGSQRIYSSWKELIAKWADVISNKGIKRVEGNVIADTSLWDPPKAVPSWEWEDLGSYYAALPSCLSFHDNLYFLSFATNGTLGKKAPISSIDPPLPFSCFQNEVVIGEQGSGDKAFIFGSDLDPQRVVRGSVPKSENPSFTIKGSLPDPASLCAELLKKELEKRGIQIVAQTLPSSGRTPLHTTLSPPLSQIIAWTNHESVNLYAEHLVCKLGEVYQKRGNTESGLLALRNWLQSKHLPLEGLHMVDGSGLSRKNLVTTKLLVSLLISMKDSPSFPEFFASLKEKQAGIHGKSGAMSLSRGYAGYCNDVAFAILVSGCQDSKAAQAKIDEVCSSLYDRCRKEEKARK